MVFDVRAVVTTNLPGELISATISDSSIPGAGLIKTTGTAIMKSTVPVQGTAAVRFNINRPDENTKFAIPRPLYVISYAVDTLRGTIQYELGCKVTIKENTRKDITYSANDLVDRCFDIATVQITAGEVVAWACGQAGLLRVGDPPHANKFSIKEFDASAGFVDVIADLCFSEGLLFHQRTEDELVIESSINSAFEAKVIRIIDVTPTTSGEIPGSTVVANYSTLKLLDADPSEEDNLNWEKDETIGNPVTITIRYEEGDDTWESSFNYTPYQKTITEYDEWERVVKRTTTSNSIGAAVSPNYVQALVRRDFNNNSSQIGGSALAFGNAEFVTTTTTNITYVIPCNLVPLGDCNFNVVTPPEGYEEVESEETTVNEPYAALAGSVPGDYFDENDNLDTIPAGNIVTSITTTTYEQQYRNVRVNRGEDAEGNVQIKRLGAFPVTKTKTRYRKAYAYTSYGQAELAQRGRQGNSIGESLGFASRLCDDGVEMRVVTGREATVQIRPSYLDRIFNYYADQSQLDSNDNGFGTERRAQTIQGGVETGTAASGMIAINIPYSSDDKFDRIGLPPNIKYLSVAPAPTPESVASRVLRLQAKLIVGAKSGLSVQTFPEDLPEGHASFVAINGGIYLVNNRTYTLTAEGAVASFDGIAWLQAGGLPGRLFPMPSSVTELPPLTRLIGTISTIEDDAQAELDAAFPGAELNDAVRREDNGDYWVYDGSEWVFKGPSPGAIVVNKAPDQIIGTIATVGSTPQAALNAAFPSADLKDGVRALDTNSVWVYDGTTWIDEGQNPGEVLEVTPGSTADLFNVTIDNTFVVRSRVAVTKFEYGLNLLTEVDPIDIRTVCLARPVVILDIPAVDIEIEAHAPTVGSIDPAISLVVTPFSYEPTGSALTVNLGFTPGIIWPRDLDTNNFDDTNSFDVQRGATKYFVIPDTYSTPLEKTDSQSITAFTDDGFTVGTSSLYNDTDVSLYGGHAFAPVGPATSNTDGSITSTVSANNVYSIITYTGAGVADSTVGHGLPSTPQLILISRLSGGSFYASVVGGPAVGDNYYMIPADRNGRFSSTNYIRSANSTTFTLGTGGDYAVQASGSNYVAYAFCEKPGTSKISTYEGDDSPSGQYIECGFKVDFLIVQARNASGAVDGDWLMFDRTDNTGTRYMSMIYSSVDSYADPVCILQDTGFVVLPNADNFSRLNGDNITYLYMAFARRVPSVKIEAAVNIQVTAHAPAVT